MTTQKSVPITATPATGQLVEHDGRTFETIREGKAYILIPPNTRTSVDPQAKAKADSGKDTPQNVFYNPIQQFNRDLSVLAIRAFGEDLCEKRKLQHQRDSGKLQAKKERKRKKKAETEKDGAAGHDEIKLKRKAETQGVGEGGIDGPAKLRKAEDGSAVKVDDEKAAPKQAKQHVTEEPPEHVVTSSEERNPDAATGQPGDTMKMDVTNREVANEDGATAGTDNTNGHPQTSTSNQHEPQPWKPKFRILDALSATGLRALRYAAEIPFATAVTANDMDRNAVKSIKIHVEHNKLSDKITANLGNANGHMYGIAFPPTDSHGPHHVSGRHDVIDLDPYGTAAPFIDSALQALNDGGLLCVTCTDSGVYASCGYAEKTYALYGGMPIKGSHSHEGGLRLVINSVASAAAKYGMAIEPLLSLSIDFYVRIFIRVTKSPTDVKFLAGKTMLVYDCDAGCGAWSTQTLGRNTRQTGKVSKGPHNNPTFNFKHGIAQAPSTDRLCEHCGSKMHIAGPMWASPLHNAAFVEKVLSDAREADKEVYRTLPRLEGMLDTALNELETLPEAGNTWQVAKHEDGARELLPKTPPETVDSHPFFFIPSALAKVIHCIAPPEAAIKGALRHAGYNATRSHCKPGSVKTDAPWSVIWEVMREWVRQKQPIKEGALKEGSAGWNIMQAARKPDEETNGHGDHGGEDADMPDVHAEPKGGVVKDPAAETKRMKVVFDEVLGKDKPGKRLLRYQQNPRENWGPMARAKGSG